MNTIRLLLDKLTILESVETSVVAYHGTTSKFNQIRLNQGAVYFTSDPEVAKSYGDIVEAYKLTLRNPAIVYANNENWDTMLMFNEIDVASKRITVGELFGISDKYEMVEASTIAHELNRQYGIDCVVFKDIIDTGAHVETFASSDVYVVFNLSIVQKI